MDSVRAHIIEESEYGVYVWMDTNGKIIMDEEGNVLSVPSKKGDMRKINALRDFAYVVLSANGLPQGGMPQFWSGKRQISQTEWEEQNARLRAGLTPDPFDVSDISEQEKKILRNGR